ncbi:MAG: phosphoribosyltransferase [Parachlamydiaceae bacterium]|nr:phosphoribosyltransferase [Parachlamydiaceae bacterium]
MLFKDRADAGIQLAALLKDYSSADNTVIIGLPRGGVITAAMVANELKLPLDVTCPRKIGAPGETELAIGAITETGEGTFDDDLINRLNISPEYIQEEVKKEKEVAKRRLTAYRKLRSKLDLSGRTVIIIDDGLATGATMKAAIKSIQSEGATKIVVAVPVAPPEVLEEIQKLVDEAFALDTPFLFQAIGEFYQDFTPTEDEDVEAILQDFNQTK